MCWRECVSVSVTQSVVAAPEERAELWMRPPSPGLFPSARDSTSPSPACGPHSHPQGLLPAAGFLPSVPCRCASSHPLPLRGLAAPDMAVLHVCPAAPHPALPVDPPRSRAWFSLLSLPGPRPPPAPLGPFSPSLSRFRKEASSAAPAGTAPPAQIPSAEKKPDPPVRPAWPPGPFVTQEPHLGQNGLGALLPPTPTSALPCRPGSLRPDRTGALLAPAPPSRGQGTLPASRPSHFDGVCDISCCEVKEGPLRPAPFSCSLLVRVSVFPLVRLSSKQVMVEGSHAGQLQTPASLCPLLLSLRTAGPPSATSA